MEYTVYAHKNLENEKYYVGMTSQNPKERWNNGWGYKNNTQMWKDIQESDWNKDWVHGILGKFDNKKDALKYEAFLIAMIGSIENGYNTSSYSGGTYKRSAETKRKISESQIGEKAYWFGKHFTEETKKKISEAMTGKHHSEESKKRIRENNPSKPVIQFSKDGELIAEYPSEMEACRQTGCNHSNIYKCCIGKRKSCGGFIWKYKEEGI